MVTMLVTTMVTMLVTTMVTINRKLPKIGTTLVTINRLFGGCREVAWRG